MYFRSQLLETLLKEYECDQDSATSAVDIFLEYVESGSYEDSVILAKDDDTIIEGDLETDVEYLYNTQWYWDNQEPTAPPRGLENVELPNEDKLIEKDGER